MSRLVQVWDLVGLDADERKERVKEVSFHVKTLLDNIASQEEKSCDGIKKTIVELEASVQALCLELGQTYSPVYIKNTPFSQS